MSKQIRLRVVSLRAARGHLTFGHLMWSCAIGSGGVQSFKREGDGATPAGRHKLIRLYYRHERIIRPHTPLPLKVIRPDDGWADDPQYRPYNALVRLPFSGSHEKLARDDRLYDVVGVLDYNIRPAIAHRGSAIFFHLTRDETAPPTAGCIAVEPRSMAQILRLIGRHGVFVVPPVTERHSRRTTSLNRRRPCPLATRHTRPRQGPRRSTGR